MLIRRLTIPVLALLVVSISLPSGDVSAGAQDPLAVTERDASPIFFIENTGQFADGVRFQAWAGPGLWLADDALWITVAGRGEASPVDLTADQMPRTDERFLPEWELHGMPRPYTQTVNLRLTFPGANPHPRLEPFDRVDTHVSYFLGADPAKWRADVPVWGGVRYRDLYPGVDLVVGAGLAPAPDAPVPQGGRPQGSPLQWRLEGANLSAVRLRVEGADGVAVDGDDLRLTTPLGELVLPLLQTDGTGAAEPRVESLAERPTTFDVSQPFARAATASASLTVGPASGGPARPRDLLYATFLGGQEVDWGDNITVDSIGQAYITGGTYSSDFPAARGPGYDTTFYGRTDAFVVKFDATGAQLLYATFFGGSNYFGYNSGRGIAVDGAGQAYVTGYTECADFPASAGPGYDTTFNGIRDVGDAFVVKLNSTGTQLIYATFLGGASYDWSEDLTVDGVGQAYITGDTYSADFPAVFGPGYDLGLNGGQDGFVVKLDMTGTRLIYATFLGGATWDASSSVAVDTVGQAYVTGLTWSSDFSAVDGPGYDITFNGRGDAFVIKLNAAGDRLLYATFLGGENSEEGRDIALDSVGQAYVTGYTNTPGFPAARGPGFDTTYHGHSDVFVVKLDVTGTQLRYATFLGGSDDDRGLGIAVDGAGEAYVTGDTRSSDFPASRGPGYDTIYRGGSAHGGYYDYRGDVFLVKLNRTGMRLLYATFVGGDRDDHGCDIAVDDAGQAYITGYTGSGDFPAARGPGYDATLHGDWDAFAIKLATVLPELIAGTVWLDGDGDGLRGADEPGIAGVQVCARPVGRTGPYCATTDDNGAYEIPVPIQVTFLVAPVNPPAGMTRTTRGFYLPVSLVKGEQFIYADFGFR